MNAEEAYKQTIISQNEIYLKEFQMQDVLRIIQNNIKIGNFKCNYYFDEKIKTKLISLGYDVTENLVEDKWYRTEYMTISWNFNKV